MELLSKLHPVTVHFPIAFFILFVVLEIINLFLNNYQLQFYSLILLLIGVLGGIGSVISGNLEFQALQSNANITKLHLSNIENHAQLATLTMWYFLSLLVFKAFLVIKKKNQSLLQYIFIIFALVGVYILYKTALLGGALVYKYGIGTELLN